MSIDAKVRPKELGQRTRDELAEMFEGMYSGWGRGVVVTQERSGGGETKFTERPMTPMELEARYVAAEIGINIFEIANRAAFAPIITFSQIQVHIGPAFDAARITAIKECAEKIGSMRQSEAGLFDAKHSGQRGCDRADALYDAYQALMALVPEAQR